MQICMVRGKMENVYENVKKEISPEQIKECLQTMLATLQSPEFARKVNQVKTDSGNDMVQLMKLLFPMVVEVQTQIVSSIGLPSTRDGLKEFLMKTNQMSHEDEEIRGLFMEIKSIYLPTSVYIFSQDLNYQGIIKLTLGDGLRERVCRPAWILSECPSLHKCVASYKMALNMITAIACRAEKFYT